MALYESCYGIMINLIIHDCQVCLIDKKEIKVKNKKFQSCQKMDKKEVKESKKSRSIPMLNLHPKFHQVILYPFSQATLCICAKPNHASFPNLSPHTAV